jgi:2-methylcitrate dehydratase PrpD
VASCRYEQLPAAAIAAAKRSLIDTMGAMIAGRAAPGINAMVELARQWGGSAQARVIGSGLRLPAPLAAWCNGAMARALELDDCVDYLPIHPSAMSVPALLASADTAGGMSGRDFLTALAVAQDLKIRFGLAVQRNAMQSGRNNAFKIYAAIAGVANAWRLPVEQVHHALGIGSSYAVGDGQCAIDGSMALRVQYGNVAQGALHAVLLARLGFTGPAFFLTGRYGYFAALEPEHKVQALVDRLGQEFHGATVSTKPYAACRATHAAIDLARQLRARLGGAKQAQERIKALQIFVNPEIDGLVGSPHADKIRPATGPAAQFSLQFTVASALLHDGFGLQDSLPSALQETDRLALAQRISVLADPARRTGSVLGRTGMCAHLHDGQLIELECEHPGGSPQHPISFAGLRSKLLDCVAFSGRPIQASAVDRLMEGVERLESVADVAALITDFV